MATTELFEHLPFAAKAQSEGAGRFLWAKEDLSTLQINITKRCNLACKHCHVGSGPARDEEMDKEALEACLSVFAEGPFTTLDITGGSPELNVHYRWLVREAARLAAEKQAKGQETTLITRTNAVLLTQDGFEDLPALWAAHGIQVVASLPHYEERKTNRMRGEGVFEQVLAGLSALNAVGYGKEEGVSAPGNGAGKSDAAGGSTASHSNTSGVSLVLNIVVNPLGAILPPSQASAERTYRTELAERFGITFNKLLVITNNPVGRFREFLEGRGLLDDYLAKLYNAFNPATVEVAMCRSQVSVDVDGRLYDCDFNQIAGLPILASCKTEGYPFRDATDAPLTALTIFDVQKNGWEAVSSRKLRVSGHCYACTAGAGSSCGGSTV